MMVERLFLGVPPGCLRFVIFPDHTHYFLDATTKYQRLKYEGTTFNLVNIHTNKLTLKQYYNYENTTY